MLMKEKDKITDFERLKHQLTLAQIRVVNKLRFLPHDVSDMRKQINYKLLVSPEAHEQAKIYARAFTMDMIDFLWTDTEKKLSLLHADERQRVLMPIMFESSKSSQTYSSSYKPYVDYRGYPMLIHFFRNVTRAENATDERSRLIASIDIRLSPQFSIITRFDLSDHRAPTFDFCGSGPFSFTTDLAFIAPPEEIKTRDQAAYYLSTYKPPTSVTEYNLYQKDRIVVHHLGPEQLREGARTEQWHFLGKHKSGRINREYFVYGTYDLLGLTKG